MWQVRGGLGGGVATGEGEVHQQDQRWEVRRRIQQGPEGRQGEVFLEQW